MGDRQFLGALFASATNIWCLSSGTPVMITQGWRVGWGVGRAATSATGLLLKAVGLLRATEATQPVSLIGVTFQATEFPLSSSCLRPEFGREGTSSQCFMLHKKKKKKKLFIDMDSLPGDRFYSGQHIIRKGPS